MTHHHAIAPACGNRSAVQPLFLLHIHGPLNTNPCITAPVMIASCRITGYDIPPQNALPLLPITKCHGSSIHFFFVLHRPATKWWSPLAHGFGFRKQHGNPSASPRGFPHKLVLSLSPPPQHHTPLPTHQVTDIDQSHVKGLVHRGLRAAAIAPKAHACTPTHVPLIVNGVNIFEPPCMSPGSSHGVQVLGLLADYPIFALVPQ